MQQSPSLETVTQLVKKFSAFNGNGRFITVFKTARHLFLTRARVIQSNSPISTSLWSILILSSHLRLRSSKWSLSLRSIHQYPACTSPVPIHATCFAHLLNLMTWIYGEHRTWSLSLCFLQSPVTSSVLGLLAQYWIPSAYVPPSMCETKFHTHTKQKTKL